MNKLLKNQTNLFAIILVVVVAISAGWYSIIYGKYKNTNEKLCVVIFTESSNKIALVCGVTKNLSESLSAKEVVSQLSNQINGKGGGRSDFAQGAGETDNIKDFVTSIPNSVKSLAK